MSDIEEPVEGQPEAEEKVIPKDVPVHPQPHPYEPGKEQAGPVPTRTGAVPSRQTRKGATSVRYGI